MGRGLSVEGTSAARLRSGRSQLSTGWIRLGAATVVVVGGAVALGYAFAGSAQTLPAGTKIAGVPVGGLTQKQARQLLAHRSAALADVPVDFTAGGRTFAIRPATLGVTIDWAATVSSAASKGDGF